MKAEHLNSFIQGAQSIIGTICGENAGLGKLFIKQLPYKSEDLSVIIGITGELQGDVIFTMNKNMAIFFAAKLMKNMDSSMVEQMWESAISEATNMISGKVASIFFVNGITIDITPPTLLLNPQPSQFSFIPEGAKLVCMPLVFENGGVFEIDILIN